MKSLLTHRFGIAFAVLFIFFVTTAEFCQTLSDFFSSLPEVSRTDEDGNTVGRVCEDLEDKTMVCTNTLKNGDKTVTTYSAERKIISIHVIKKPKANATN